MINCNTEKHLMSKFEDTLSCHRCLMMTKKSSSIQDKCVSCDAQGDSTEGAMWMIKNKQKTKLIYEFST